MPEQYWAYEFDTEKKLSRLTKAYLKIKINKTDTCMLKDFWGNQSIFLNEAENNSNW